MIIITSTQGARKIHPSAAMTLLIIIVVIVTIFSTFIITVIIIIIIMNGILDTTFVPGEWA